MKRQPATAPTTAAETESEEGTLRSRKRRRPNEVADPAPDDGAGDSASGPKKRGRPSRAAPAVEDHVAPAAATAPKRRGRPSLKPVAAETVPSPEPDPPPAHANEPDDGPRAGKRRSRKKASAVTQQGAGVSKEAENAGRSVRRSKRSFQSLGVNPSASGSENLAESSSAEAAGAPKRKRGRPSLTNLSIQETQKIGRAHV